MEKRERRFEVVPLAESIRKEAGKQSEERARMTNVKYKPCRNLEGSPAIKRRYQAADSRSIIHQQPDSAARATTAMKRVLLVDNDRIVADTLTAILRNAG